MAEQSNTIFLPKIKKVNFLSKVLLDPADFHKGLPKIKLPQLHQKGLILSLQSRKIGVAKMTGDGSLKLKVFYNAQVLNLLGKYIEAKVIDDYDPQWLGDFFGIPVKGSGGSGSTRGCKVVRFEKNRLIVEWMCEAGNEAWARLQKKIERTLELAI